MTTAIDIAAAKHAIRAEMGWRWEGRHSKAWHGLPFGVVGIGFGIKRAEGKRAERDCIRVYVRKKLSKRDLTRRQSIPHKIAGFLTDVVPIQSIKVHAAPGDSIGDHTGDAGTLGCIVKDQSSRYLLGSWHVLTNVYGHDGDLVYMPSLALDANASAVATLIATPIFHLNAGSNAFDASVAKISDGVSIATDVSGLGTLALPCAEATQSASVIKQGAATGITTGVVDGVSEDVHIQYNGEPSLSAILAGQMAIVPDQGDFSDEGDSGALVCTRDLHPLGLIVGGAASSSDNPLAHSFASPIQAVLDFYQVNITTS